MSYTEVTLEQLREHIHEPAIEELIDAIRSSPDSIQTWIDTAEEAFPVIIDRGTRLSLGLDVPRDGT